MPDTPFTRALGTATPSTINHEKRTVDVVALSGLAPAVRQGPAPDGTNSAWIEELDAAGADLSRFIGGPALKDHRPTTDSTVGVVDVARIQGAQIVATIRFSNKPAAAEVFGDVGAGIIRGVSLGYEVTTWQAAGKRDGLPVFRAVTWQPYEISFTPTPVDSGATVRSKEVIMTTQVTGAPSTEAPQQTQQPGSGAVPPVVPPVLTRAKEIRQIVKLAGLGAEIGDELIDSGATVEQARTRAFEEMAKRGGGAIQTGASVQVLQDHTDPAEMRRAMADAIAARLAPGAVKVEGRAREFMGHRALDMVGELAVARGHRFDRFDQNALLERSIGAHSTGDFPLLLADAGNKILMAKYAAAAPTYRIWASRKGFNDFKPHNFLRVGDFPGFKPLNEGGELKYGTMSENREQVSAAEFATGIAIGRRALINDDLSALSDFSSMIAIRAASDENRLVYGVLIANPAMSDGKTLFHAGHANMAAAGGAITVANVGAAVAALRKQKSPDGIPLNLAPRFLVVGPDKELEGRQVLASITPTKTGDTNPWAGLMELVVDANITGNGWYVMADPSMCPTVVYGYVAGSEGPQITTATDFDTQAVKVRAGLDFGYGIIDFRGAFQNAGN